MLCSKTPCGSRGNVVIVICPIRAETTAMASLLQKTSRAEHVVSCGGEAMQPCLKRRRRSLTPMHLKVTATTQVDYALTQRDHFSQLESDKRMWKGDSNYQQKYSRWGGAGVESGGIFSC